MTIHSWRIVKAKLAAEAFSGEGAKDFGGRWNSPGVPVVYTAGSAALAMLETLVHLQSEELLRRYVLFDVTFDDSMMSSVDPSKLPRAWKESPPAREIQHIGDAWATSGESVVLRVPSVIVPAEWNYLLNPVHPDFHKITIGAKQPARFDPRLIKK